MNKLEITSIAFENDGFIPKQFTCEGENISPPLTINGVPDGTTSLVLVVTDPDIPTEVKKGMDIEVFDHWVAFNISPKTRTINAGEAAGIQGKNSSDENGYTGPCPPAEYEPTEHRYVFRLYALDTKLTLDAGASKESVQQAMSGHELDTAKLVGRYEK